MKIKIISFVLPFFLCLNTDIISQISDSTELVGFAEFLEKGQLHKYAAEEYERLYFMFPQEKSVCNVNQNEILSHMTLKDFETIVEYKLPQLSDLDLVQVEFHSNFPGIGMPLNLKNSIFLLEISLLITVIYFWLCQNEAKQSTNYPGPGTIFTIFTRTNINWFIFSVLCSFPPIIGFILALATESQPEIWANMVVASLTFIFSFLVSLNFKKCPRATQENR